VLGEATKQATYPNGRDIAMDSRLSTRPREPVMAFKRIGAGNRMSDAVIHGDKIYLSGYIAETTVGKSVKEQTQDILGQIDETLKQAGTDKTRIIKANIWLTDIATWAEMNEAWDAWVVPSQAPARATVEARLAGPGLDVEIMVEAAI
jgi:enamine deaminase RidA (YjgF/YER057c/UK114 family)